MVFEVLTAAADESEWLTQQQNAALRAALEWLANHPPEPKETDNDR
jgi:hypothetical protein